MHIIFKIIIITSLSLLGIAVLAKEKIICSDQIPNIIETDYQKIVSQRIITCLIRSHYRKFELNNIFAEKVFNRYLCMLDYNHNIFILEDIKRYSRLQSNILDDLKSGNLNLFFKVYNLAQQRRFERCEYVLKKLKEPIDFNGYEKTKINFRKKIWSKSIEELNILWNDKIKYDEINLKFVKEKEENIRKILIKRYKHEIKRLTQGKSEDVFQLVMNAFSHEVDPHTNYLSPCNADQFNSDMSLLLDGIGVKLQINENHIVITSIFFNGPAEKTKQISVGDRIIGVGQTSKTIVNVIGWRLDDVISLIKGPKKTKVYLKLISNEKDKRIRIVRVIRDRIRLEERAVKMIIKSIGTQNIAILNAPGFYVGLTSDIKIKLKNLEKEKVRGIVIDLRSNGGGALTEAVSLSGLFIPTGPVVQVRDNQDKIHEDRDTDGIVYYNGPLVVLVNRYSASASEIFASAMQDYGRALVVGEPTFGKGTVQQYRSLNRIYDHILHPTWPELGSIQYTTQKFYRINGDSTQRKGVIPDIIIPYYNREEKIGEKFEDNALPWDRINPASYKAIANLRICFNKLIKAHLNRIKNDPKFNYITQDSTCFKKIKEGYKFISINFLQENKKNKQDNIIYLSKMNNSSLNQDQKSSKIEKETTKVFNTTDPYLDEVLRITLDFAETQ